VTVEVPASLISGAFSATFPKLMDPYDQPSQTTITPKCLRKWGKASFKESFLDEMESSQDDLPLYEMCGDDRASTGDSWARCENLQFSNKTPPILEGCFEVKFTALKGTGCRDLFIPFDVAGKLYFKLDLRTGEVTFERPQSCSDYGHC